MASGKLGASRMDMNRVCVGHFRDWLGESTAVEEINEAKWLNWHNHLAGRVAAGMGGEPRPPHIRRRPAVRPLPVGNAADRTAEKPGQ